MNAVSVLKSTVINVELDIESYEKCLGSASFLDGNREKLLT